MPGMKAVGTNTAVRIRAMATTGPGHLVHRLEEGARRQPALDEADGFDDDDGVVDDDADGRTGQRATAVDGELAGEDRERTHHPHGEQWDECRAEALQENEDDDDTRISASNSV